MLGRVSSVSVSSESTQLFVCLCFSISVSLNLCPSLLSLAVSVVRLCLCCTLPQSLCAVLCSSHSSLWSVYRVIHTTSRNALTQPLTLTASALVSLSQHLPVLQQFPSLISLVRDDQTLKMYCSFRYERKRFFSIEIVN